MVVRRVEGVPYGSVCENWSLCLCVVVSAWARAVYAPLIINTAAVPLARPCPGI